MRRAEVTVAAATALVDVRVAVSIWSAQVEVRTTASE